MEAFPALVAGNTAVIKPAQDTPLSTLNFVQALTDGGIPAGVVNIVTGFGGEVGTPMVEHPEVRAVSLTGSTAVGRIVGQEAAKTFKHCSLELGGKNPMIVLDDANLELALEGALWGAFGTTGQRCTATSRIIVQKGVYKKFVDELVARAQKLKVGNGLDESVDMGPAVNSSQMETDLKYIKIGKDEGAKMLCGGHRLEGEATTMAGSLRRRCLPMSIPRCELRRKKSSGRWCRSFLATGWRTRSRSPTTSSTGCRRRFTPRT